MARKAEPLSYAIVRLFADGRRRCAADVVSELEPTYGGHRLLTKKGVDEALATAKENGLLDESGAEIANDGELLIFYTLSGYGRDMVEKYL